MMSVRPTRTDRARLATASGGLLGAAALLTTAYFTDFADLEAQVDGSGNTFDIVVAGSVDPGWRPGPGDWVQGDDEPYVIDLGDESALPPGATTHVRIAVKNDSPRIAAGIALEIRDPDPLGDETDPETGRYLELFDKLEFALSDSGTTFFEASGSGTAAERTHTWPAALRPGQIRLIDVAVTLPRDVDDRWQAAGTQVQFGFEAVSNVDSQG